MARLLPGLLELAQTGLRDLDIRDCCDWPEDCPGGARRVRRVVLAVDAAPDGRSSRLRRSWGVSGGPERRSQVAWWSDSWEFDQI